MDSEMKNLFAIIISGYAAIISTITLIWNIANSILDRMSRIKVEARFFDTFFADTGACKAVTGAAVLSVTVVNSSKKIKYINKPILKFPYKFLSHGKKVNEVGLTNLRSKRSWPIELKPEATITLNYPVCREGTEWFLSKDKDNKKFKILVTDTINKKYYSNKMKINILRDVIEFNSGLEKEILNQTVEAYS